jgi:ribonuclease E
MKRMLFNATHAEQLRVAIVDGQKLLDLDIETSGREQRKSNIYKGVVTRVEPSLEACFVDYGEERHGFLPFKEISRQYFKSGVDVGRARISDVISEGQQLIVQVEKEERGNKGAALTTFISLAGRYLVLMPNNPRGGGVSRRVEGEDRQELREALDQLDLPSGMSVIARTAGIGRAVEELQWDLRYLLQLWKAITDAVDAVKAPELIYLESSLVIRAIRDYFNPDIGEILIDTEDVYEQAKTFVDLVMPDVAPRVKRYRDDVPLFSRFQIEHQIETAHSRTVSLPSGGAIVIDHTEALVAIDVNSAQATRGSDIEETALRTNLEAADEAARQLRLRDLGGLIVIDFIDMDEGRNQRAVEQRLKDGLHHDRARVQMGKISRFGLMELSRQRLRPALSEGSHITCPRCNGVGQVRDTESSALHILRILQEEAMKESTAAVHAQVPVDVATYLLNEKRADISKLEARQRVSVVLIPNRHLETPHYSIERLRHDDERLDTPTASYNRVAAQSSEESYQGSGTKAEPRNRRQVAVVKGIIPETPAPVVAAPEPKASSAAVKSAKPSLWARIGAWFGAGKSDKTATTESTTPTSNESSRPGRDGQRQGRDANRRGERGGRDRRQGRQDRTERQDSERQDRPDNRADANREGGRNERGNRRNDRGNRQRDPETTTVDAAVATDSRQATPETAATERPEGGRGRRGRRDRRPDDRGAEGSPAQELNPAMDAVPVATVEPTPTDSTTTEGDVTTVDSTRPDGGDDERRGRNRRRRRGRGRGGDRPNATDAGADGQVQGDDEGSDNDADATTPPSTPAIVESPAAPVAAPQTATVVEAIVATPLAPVEPTSAIDVAAVAITTVQTVELVSPIEPVVRPADAIPPAPEPVIEPAAPAIVVEAAPMDLTALAPVLDAAGIQLAQTDPTKIAAAQARAEAEAKAVVRGRPRPVRAALVDEPLVQVQTQDTP